MQAPCGSSPRCGSAERRRVPFEVVGVTGRLYDPYPGGIGYLAVAAALLGATNPAGAAAASLVLAALGAGAGALQRVSGVPASLAQIVPAVAVLSLLAIKSRRKAQAA